MAYECNLFKLLFAKIMYNAEIFFLNNNVFLISVIVWIIRTVRKKILEADQIIYWKNSLVKVSKDLAMNDLLKIIKIIM